MDSEAGAKQAKLEAAKQEEIPLPKLTLTEKYISETKLDPSMIETFSRQDNYLVVKTSEGIKVFDPECREVDDFNKIGYPGVKVRGSALHKALGENNPKIAKLPGNKIQGRWLKPERGTAVGWRDFPAFVQDFFDQALPSLLNDPESRKSTEVGWEPNRNDQRETGYWNTSLEKNHVFHLQAPTRPGTPISFLDEPGRIGWANPDTGEFVYYQTRDREGRPLPPRNWERTDPGSYLQAEQYSSVAPTSKQIQETVTEIKSAARDGHQLVGTTNIEGTPEEILIGTGKGRGVTSVAFRDSIERANKNIAIDPANPGVVYYCRQNNPSELIRVDANEDRPQPQAARLPAPYPEITNLTLDPTGNFFIFSSQGQLVVLDKTSLAEVGRLGHILKAKLTEDGHIWAVKDTGQVALLATDLPKIRQAFEQRKTAKLLEGIQTDDLFKTETAGADHQATPEQQSLAERLGPVADKYRQDFENALKQVTTVGDIAPIRNAVSVLRQRLVGQGGLSSQEVDYIINEVSRPVTDAERQLVQSEAAQQLDDLRKAITGGNLTLSTITSLRQNLDTLAARKAIVDPATSQAIGQLEGEFNTQTAEFFAKEGSQIEERAGQLLETVRAELQSMTSVHQFDAWEEYSKPQIRAQLGMLLNNCPVEILTTRQKLLEAAQDLETLAGEYQKRFETEYSKVRERAAELMDQQLVHVREYIANTFARFERKGFKTRAEAELQLEQSADIKNIWEEIQAVGKENPDAGKALERDVKSMRANFLSSVERRDRLKVADTGQQIIMIGETPFPKWEARVKEHKNPELSATFIRDEGTHGQDIHGDIGLVAKKDDGTTTTIRLYEGSAFEDDFRHGAAVWLGERYAPGSYVSRAEYAKFKRDYEQWQGKYEGVPGQKPAPEEGQHVARLKQELQMRLQELHALTLARRDKQTWTQQQEDEYQQKGREYIDWSAEHHISMLHRIDHMRASEQEEHINGKGFVPSWQSHWVMDGQTETYLGEMAKTLKMQLDTHEGMLNLKGHAGTGKDVLVKMFCNLTNRPYFATDCSKWTTEFELSEDVILEAKDGASYTVKVPSTVLNAITTPGAVMYFNEFNAMPEQAQIFLHGLLDEKRSLTLKTSSGKTITAHPSVLLISSMNPGYPGTFDPQFATKSRMVSMPIDYPPTFVKPDKGDPNQHDLVSSAEALRIARGVDSLSDLTYDQNPSTNEFNRLWNQEINRQPGGMPAPTPEQRFDLEVILALVEFSDKLRADFIKNFEKSRDARNALPVTQPITGREMRRAAYELSQIPIDQKTQQNNPEVVARQLFERFYLTHYDKIEDREKIKTAMQSWTSQKRVS